MATCVMKVATDDIERRALAGDVDAQIQFSQSLNKDGQRESAEKWLRQAAGQGGSKAKLALGRHLLSSPPPVSRTVIEEGRNLIISAAAAGNGQAAHFAALMHGIDSSVPEHFATALDYLARGAEVGYLPAQAELATLACNRNVIAALSAGQPLSPAIWSELRRSINADKLKSVSAPTIVRNSPFIATAEKFVSPETCDWLIKKARPNLDRTRTYNSSAVSGGETVSGRPVAHHRAASPELDLVLLPVLHRISAITRIPMNGMEPTSILHYATGEEYQPHYDFLDPAVPSFAAQIARAGQRIITVLVYLNDDFEGGETDFPRVGVRHKGRKGDALLFRNVDGQGEPDSRTFHAGLPPVKGEKWLLARACTFKQA